MRNIKDINKTKKQISVSIPLPLLKKLDKEASDLKISRSELVLMNLYIADRVKNNDYVKSIRKLQQEIEQLKRKKVDDYSDFEQDEKLQQEIESYKDKPCSIADFKYRLNYVVTKTERGYSQENKTYNPTKLKKYIKQKLLKYVISN